MTSRVEETDGQGDAHATVVGLVHAPRATEDRLRLGRAGAGGVAEPDELAHRGIVHGVGLDGLKAPDAPLDCGNAGTGMRLLAGLLAGQAFDCTLIGDESLSGRPMRRVMEPLALMGARIDAVDGHAPLTVHGTTLHPISFAPKVPSAPIRSRPNHSARPASPLPSAK